MDPAWSRDSRPNPSGDWYEFQARDAARLTIGIRLGEPAASIAGSVAQRGASAPGVPVFLYPIDAETRVRSAGNRLTFSDENGRYRLDGLPPGRYLLAATFEISTPTEDAMRLARAEEVVLGSGGNEERALTLYTEQPQ